jgi:cytochrome P450
MHYFLKQAKKEQLLIKTIKAQAIVAILAGSETSLVAETAAVYYILTYPNIYKKRFGVPLLALGISSCKICCLSYHTWML